MLYLDRNMMAGTALRPMEPTFPGLALATHDEARQAPKIRDTHGMMSIEQEARVGVFMRRTVEKALAVATVGLGVLAMLLPGAWGHDPFYRLLLAFMPQQGWGTMFFAIGVVRSVFLIVNGYYPLSPLVRLTLSLATGVLVWLPLTISYGWFYCEMFVQHGGVLLPGMVFSPTIAFLEALCSFTLSALWEASRVGPAAVI